MGNTVTYLGPSSPLKRKLPLLDRLPLEILTLVLLELDPYTIRSLIRAYLHMARYFIIVIDLGSNQPLKPRFFESLGIDVLRVEDYLPACRRQGRKLVTLFEIRMDQRYQIDHGHQNLLSNRIGRASIVYYHTSRMEGHQDPCFLLSVKTKARVYIERSHIIEPAFADMITLIRDEDSELTISVNGDLITPKESYFQTLRILDIHEGVSVLENQRLGSLVRLTITFTRKSSRPVVRNITAPCLRTLKLCYTSDFPIMQGLCLADSNGSEETTTLLQLININSIQSDIREPLPQCPTPISELELLDLTFSKNFREIHVVGGPDVCIVLGLGLHDCIKLLWKQTHKQHEECYENWRWMHLAGITNITSLSFETCLPCVRDPPFMSLRLEDLTIISHNVGLCCIGILCNDMSRLTQFTFMCNAGLFGDKKEDISTEKVYDNVLTMPAALNNLTLRGVEIDRDLSREFASLPLW